MNNLIGLAVSYAYVGMVLLASAYLQKTFSISAEVTRKIIHISVSHWWLILMYFFDSLPFAIIGPISFIIINYLSYRYHLMPAMELKDNKKNLGTVYFPISLLVLVLLSYLEFIPIYAGAVGILIMGYGDGFASLFGQRYGGRSKIIFWGGTKSILGSVVMFVLSALVTLAVTRYFHPYAHDSSMLLLVTIVTAATATAVELMTPFGLDNITVPIISALVYSGLT